mmetsp:Transcript_17526/g.25100  ORF Transcript_17526/g.25100 Transcript_17526/m.25100 type:complete len:113 (-) Transcript_17526:143-481(-)
MLRIQNVAASCGAVFESDCNNIKPATSHGNGLGTKILPAHTSCVVLTTACSVGVEVLVFHSVQSQLDSVVGGWLGHVKLALNEHSRGVDDDVGCGGKVETAHNVEAIGESHG